MAKALDIERMKDQSNKILDHFGTLGCGAILILESDVAGCLTTNIFDVAKVISMIEAAKIQLLQQIAQASQEGTVQ